MPRWFTLAAYIAMAICVTPALAAPVVFRDDFTGYGPSRTLDSVWDVSGGKVALHGGKLVLLGPGSPVACLAAVPERHEQVIEATVTPEKRTAAGSWSAAGIALYGDAGNYWRLSLVEGPTGQRYFELVEMHDSIWQAQNEPGARLTPIEESAASGGWEFGKTYRMRLAIVADRVVGETVGPDGASAPIYRKGFVLPRDVPSVRLGRLALTAVDMQAAFGSVLVSSDEARPTGASARPSGRYRVAVHGAAATPVAAALRRAGIEARPIRDGDVTGPDSLRPGVFDALVMTDASRFPIAARDNLLAFLRGGGSMVVVGGPVFEESVKQAQDERTRQLGEVPSEKALIELSGPEAAVWSRSSSTMSAPTRWSVEPSGLPGAGDALHVRVAGLSGWDTLSTPIVGAFPPGDALTIFQAKGGPKTTGLMLEIQEKDGSRWIATTPLTTEWRRIALPIEEFRYWPDSRSKGRGGPGDKLNPASAALIAIGLADSHLTLTGADHEYWVASPSVGRMPADLRRVDTTLPLLDLFTPFYKYYRLPSLQPTTAQLRTVAETGDQSGPIVTPIPRPRGLGFPPGRGRRWLPLAEIRDTTGAIRGTRTSLMVNCALPYRGSIWGQIAAPDKAGGLPQDIVELVRRITDGVFLSRAGAEQFSYFVGESVPLGFEVVNYGRTSRRVTIHQSIVSSAGAQMWEAHATAVVASGGSFAARHWWRPVRPVPGLYRVITQVIEGGRVVDQIEQPISILATPNAAKSAFVDVRNGTFTAPLAGKARRIWSPYGVNYWQSNVVGTDSREYSLHWLAAGFYDPAIVERDLTTLQSLGFTSVSIQLSSLEHVRQVNDFIYRASHHGIRVNLFISGAHPFAQDEALYTKLLREGRLAGNPGVWAYDIAWEHHLGSHDERAAWDRDWEAWVIQRYGTIEHAEQNWGFSIPRDAGGRVTNPLDEQLRGDGPWLKMAAAYERCADDVIAHRYAEITGKIRALDPNHLISARSASQPSWSGWFAYDMLSCGKAFDFSSPEGYGLVPAEGGFSVAYARYAGNSKPVYWAEFGSSIYPYDTTGDKEREQERLHAGFAKMLLDSGANGLCSWWNVGGYRVDERSDFGIIATDGTPRASARALQARAREATSPRPPKAPQVWVTIDRDLHAAAYDAVYRDHRLSYTEAVKAGKMVGVRTAGTGTTSGNTPLECVGNVPYDGFNPLKHLNGEFYHVQIKCLRGAWRDVEDGETVNVAAGRAVLARIVAGNRGEASWNAAGDGAVSLIGDDRKDANSTARPRLTFSVPVPRAARRYEDVSWKDVTICPAIVAESEVVFTFEAAGRARFGERRRVVLRPI